MGQDQDDTVMVPYTTVQKRLLGITHVSNITVSAPTACLVAGVGGDRRRCCAGGIACSPAGPDDFTIRTLEEMASVLTSTTTTMT